MSLVIAIAAIALAGLALGISVYTLLAAGRIVAKVKKAVREHEASKPCGLCGEPTTDPERRPSSIQKYQASPNTLFVPGGPRVGRVHDECWEAYKSDPNKVEVTA